MPGRDTLKETVKQSTRDMVDEANRLWEAADKPGQVTEGFVREHARHAREAVDRAEDAALVLVREGE